MMIMQLSLLFSAVLQNYLALNAEQYWFLSWEIIFLILMVRHIKSRVDVLPKYAVAKMPGVQTPVFSSVKSKIL